MINGKILAQGGDERWKKNVTILLYRRPKPNSEECWERAVFQIKVEMLAGGQEVKQEVGFVEVSEEGWESLLNVLFENTNYRITYMPTSWDKTSSSRKTENVCVLFSRNGYLKGFWGWGRLCYSVVFLSFFNIKVVTRWESNSEKSTPPGDIEDDWTWNPQVLIERFEPSTLAL